MIESIRQIFRPSLSKDGQITRLLIITALIFATFSILMPDIFFSARNMRSMAVQFPEFGILAFAILITMLTGGIDLSIVGAANLCAVAAALVITRLGGDGGMLAPFMVLPVAVFAAMIVGSLCGLFNGFLVAKVGITPILATLGTMSLYTGLGYVATGGPAITTTRLAFIGGGAVWGVPIPVIVFLGVAIFFAVLLNRTTFGFNVYLLGSNPTAAKFSGINIDATLIRTYWLSGMVASVAGLIFLSRANSAKPDYGESFVLLTVLIAILGGTSYLGGVGTVTGMILAVLSLQFLSTGLNMLMLDLIGSSASTFFRQFAWVAVLLIVMVITYYSDKRRDRLLRKLQSEN
jgi:simple sugar transport system permease protein